MHTKMHSDILFVLGRGKRRKKKEKKKCERAFKAWEKVSTKC